MAGPSRSKPRAGPSRGSFGSRRIELVAIGVASALVAGAAVFGMRYARSPGGPEAAAPAAAGLITNAPLPPIQGVGITDTDLVFGMASPFSGANKETGRALKAGIDVAFAATNAAGGVHGRRLHLVALDDGYEPERTKVVMKELLEERKVFGLIGNYGSSTAAVAIPMAAERKVPFYAPYTGAALTRKQPPDRYVFNFRPSAPEETIAAVRYLVQVRRVAPEEIAVFAQEDAFGDAGFAGVVTALAGFKRSENQILRVGYRRNSVDVDEAVTRIQKESGRLKAVVMVATYKAAARFIERIRGAGLDLVLTNISAVNAGQLAEEVAPLGAKVAADVVVTQVVPSPASQATAVMKYREALVQYAPSEVPDFASLEGFLSANLLVEALRRAGKDLDADKLVDALESIQALDLGIGTPLSFSKADHQASHKVWGTMLEPSGKYRSIELE
jgi:branched-chain amino acid transport system substrate-binding protein